MKVTLGGIVLALLLARSLQAQSVDIEDQLKPSVVAIRNDECFGSGMLLDGQGLILTNAHVACSPLPYRVHAWANVDGAYKDVVFKKVQLLGFHPSYDLALLRIDPSECGATLQPVKIAGGPPDSRERIWAVGFPQDYGRGTVKVATWGEVKSPKFDFYGENYLELDISINHGNSGGPACNGKGEVVGVIAMMIKDSALAVPIAAYKPDRFGPLRERVPNREISSQLIESAEKMWPGDRDGLPPMQAMMLYEMALLWDSGNEALYSKVGQLNLRAGRYPAAVAYLVRSLRMEPWSEAETYRSLGAALTLMHKTDEALAIFEEGLRKYPADNGQLWGELAVFLERTGKYFDAAVGARMAIKTFVRNSAPVNEAYKRSVERLSTDQLSRLREIESDVDGHLRLLRADSDRARRDNKAFMLPKAEEIVGSYAGTQKEQVATKVVRAELPPLNLSDEELAVRFIHNRIEVAKEHARLGNRDKAIDILEDVIGSYPRQPETESARLLLKFLKK